MAIYLSVGKYKILLFPHQWISTLQNTPNTLILLQSSVPADFYEYKMWDVHRKIHYAQYSLTLFQVELQVQENRKKTEVQIGKEPVSKQQTLVDECYNELMEMAKTLGVYIQM